MTHLTDFQQKLSLSFPEMELRFYESMAKHTSFRIGGPAEVMAFPKTREELAELSRKESAITGRPVNYHGMDTDNVMVITELLRAEGKAEV